MKNKKTCKKRISHSTFRHLKLSIRSIFFGLIGICLSCQLPRRWVLLQTICLFLSLFIEVWGFSHFRRLDGTLMHRCRLLKVVFHGLGSKTHISNRIPLFQAIALLHIVLPTESAKHAFAFNIQQTPFMRLTTLSKFGISQPFVLKFVAGWIFCVFRTNFVAVAVYAKIIIVNVIFYNIIKLFLELFKYFLLAPC